MESKLQEPFNLPAGSVRAVRDYFSSRELQAERERAKDAPEATSTSTA